MLLSSSYLYLAFTLGIEIEILSSFVHFSINREFFTEASEQKQPNFYYNKKKTRYGKTIGNTKYISTLFDYQELLSLLLVIQYFFSYSDWRHLFVDICV